jgi:hypothetical protein
MKTKKIISAVMIIAGLIISSKNSNGQNTVSNAAWNKDQLFAGKGKSTLMVGTGVPYIAAVEYAYGFSNRFSAGLFFGKNPSPGVRAMGIRLRGILFSKNSLRMYLETPVLLYPENKKNEAWFLIYPNLIIEKRFNSGVRLSAGVGVTAAGCVDAFFEAEHHHITEGENMPVMEKESVFADDGGIMGGLWYTLNAGVAFPVANRIMFQQKLNVVADGIKAGNIHKKKWFYSPGIIMLTGVSYTF